MWKWHQVNLQLGAAREQVLSRGKGSTGFMVDTLRRQSVFYLELIFVTHQKPKVVSQGLCRHNHTVAGGWDINHSGGFFSSLSSSRSCVSESLFSRPLDPEVQGWSLLPRMQNGPISPKCLLRPKMS